MKTRTLPSCILVTIQRERYCICINRYTPMGLLGQQWKATEWTYAMHYCHIHNDKVNAHIMSGEGIWSKTWHRPDLPIPLQSYICIKMPWARLRRGQKDNPDKVLCRWFWNVAGMLVCMLLRETKVLLLEMGCFACLY